MAINRKLFTDTDFAEVVKKGTPIRVFQDNHIVEARTVVIRFDDAVIVTQAAVSDLTYHNRNDCEFYELRKR